MDDPTNPAPSALAALLAELKKPGSLSLLFMATMLSIISNMNMPDWNVPAVWLATVLILWVAYIWISTAALRGQLIISRALKVRADELESLPSLQIPKVIKAMKGMTDGDDLILLLRPNQLFGQSMLVSIYFEDERGLELLVADGSVANVQTNGLIQVSANSWKEPHRDIRQRIIEQDHAVIDRLIVKPATNTARVHDDMNAELINFLVNRTGRGI